MPKTKPHPRQAGQQRSEHRVVLVLRVAGRPLLRGYLHKTLAKLEHQTA